MGKTVGRSIGERVRYARIARNLSITQLAIKVGVHYNTIRNCELGEQEISFSKALRIAKGLNVSLDWLAGRID